MLAENLLPMDIEIITSSPLSILNMQDTWGWYYENQALSLSDQCIGCW
jgi:hypothetical protein